MLKQMVAQRTRTIEVQGIPWSHPNALHANLVYSTYVVQ